MIVGLKRACARGCRIHCSLTQAQAIRLPEAGVHVAVQPECAHCIEVGRPLV